MIVTNVTNGVSARRLRDHLDAEFTGEPFLLADGFDEALIGVTVGWFAGGNRGPVALYDHEKCVQILMSDGLTEDDAQEHMDYNVTGAYAGDGTPCFAVIYRPPTVVELFAA